MPGFIQNPLSNCWYNFAVKVAQCCPCMDSRLFERGDASAGPSRSPSQGSESWEAGLPPARPNSPVQPQPPFVELAAPSHAAQARPTLPPAAAPHHIVLRPPAPPAAG